jgi:hypothetical protein
MLENDSGFEIVTQFADTGKRPSSHLLSMVLCYINFPAIMGSWYFPIFLPLGCTSAFINQVLDHLWSTHAETTAHEIKQKTTLSFFLSDQGFLFFFSTSHRRQQNWHGSSPASSLMTNLLGEEKKKLDSSIKI